MALGLERGFKMRCTRWSVLFLGVAAACLCLLAATRLTPSGAQHQGRGLARASDTRAIGTASVEVLDTEFREARGAPYAVNPRILVVTGVQPPGNLRAPKDRPKRPRSDYPPPEPAPEPPASPPALPPAAPGTPTMLACLSGDMKDVITFSFGDGGPVSEFVLHRAATSDGEYSQVATAPADASSFAHEVTEASYAYYRVSARGPGGQSAPSAAMRNDAVAISGSVGAEGRTLASSNGEVVLSVSAGAFAETTEVGVREVACSPIDAPLALSGIYDITPDGPLRAPATLAIRYELDVTHFEVRAAVLEAAVFKTLDSQTGIWVQDASNVSPEGDYLVGTLTHFSEWHAAHISPHGTNETTYCSDGAICHNLAAYPDSATRISARSSQVCFNCHGAASASEPAHGADGPNVQAQFYACPGQTRPAGSTVHPVITGAYSGSGNSGMYCVFCHDPHADPALSPGLLKVRDAATGTYIQGGGGIAPGNSFCWACHGTVNNKLANFWVNGYWARTDGDHKTGWTSTAGDYHGARSGTGKGGALAGGLSRGTSLQCTACHSSHGSPSVYLIPQTIGTVSIPTVTGGTNIAPMCAACHVGSVAQLHSGLLYCTYCHYYGTNSEHMWGGANPWPPIEVYMTDCLACHRHGGSWTHVSGGTVDCWTGSDCHGNEADIPFYERTF